MLNTFGLKVRVDTRTRGAWYLVFAMWCIRLTERFMSVETATRLKDAVNANMRQQAYVNGEWIDIPGKPTSREKRRAHGTIRVLDERHGEGRNVLPRSGAGTMGKQQMPQVR